MSNLFEKSVNLGLGLFVYSKEKIETIVEELVNKGEINKNEASGFVSELLEKGEKQRAEIKNMVREMVKESLELHQYVAKDELAKIVKEEVEKALKEKQETKD